jgi:Flp pilus assembly protein TadD
MQEQATPQSLVQRINDCIAAGRPGPARMLVAALRRRAPDAPFVSEIAARLAIVQGDLQSAQMELDAALASHPGDAALRRCRADLRHRLGDFVGATEDAAEAVIAAPQEPTGKAILGILMMELGRTRDAVACLREALAANPAAAAVREALACAQVADGDSDAAAATVAEGITLTPDHGGLRNAAVLLACRRSDFGEAVQLADEARRYGHADACLFHLRAHALSSLGRLAEAEKAYAEARKIGPADLSVWNLRIASGADPANPRGSTLRRPS